MLRRTYCCRCVQCTFASFAQRLMAPKRRPLLVPHISMTKANALLLRRIKCEAISYLIVAKLQYRRQFPTTNARKQPPISEFESAFGCVAARFAAADGGFAFSRVVTAATRKGPIHSTFARRSRHVASTAPGHEPRASLIAVSIVRRLSRKVMAFIFFVRKRVQTNLGANRWIAACGTRGARGD